MPEYKEKRRFPRVMVRALVDYESQNTYLYDYSENLSQGGIFIQTDNPLKIGELIDLKFSIPDIEKVFQIKGEVRWVEHQGNKQIPKGMGIEFKDLTEDDRELLKEYLSKSNK